MSGTSALQTVLSQLFGVSYPTPPSIYTPRVSNTVCKKRCGNSVMKSTGIKVSRTLNTAAKSWVDMQVGGK